MGGSLRIAESGCAARAQRTVRLLLRVAWGIPALTGIAPAQHYLETCGKSPAGFVQVAQAARDAGNDQLVLLVASHPDDRYVLPATWLRFWHGMRVAVLLATRGGGGQNSAGPETGDALERIRTLETEAGCSHFGGEAWYLDRVDGGYRRSAEETYAEWGRQETLHGLVRSLRRIRPDAVATTHHPGEAHGHDQALVELLPEAVRLAADPQHRDGETPHSVNSLWMGVEEHQPTGPLAVNVDQLDPLRGVTLRRLAYDVLKQAHRSPGEPTPMDTIFAPQLRLQPGFLQGISTDQEPLGKLPSLFDPQLWPGTTEERDGLEQFLRDLQPKIHTKELQTGQVYSVLERLRSLFEERLPQHGKSDEVSIRLGRRIEALERLLLCWIGIQVEITIPAGTVAVAGETFPATVQVHHRSNTQITLQAIGLDGLEVRSMQMMGKADGTGLSNIYRAILRMPAENRERNGQLRNRFRGDRYVPPARMRLELEVAGLRLPVTLTIPIEERPPVEIAVVPRMLLLPTGRNNGEFSVSILRNSQAPLAGELQAKASAGYIIQDDRRSVKLTENRADLFGFVLQSTATLRPGVDVLRINLDKYRVTLPLHKVEVQIPTHLRIGVIRSNDDVLAGILGVGGFGLRWSELSDTEIAAGDLTVYDTIVVDVRALRDRMQARRGFRRVLEFAQGKGRRLVLFYQKDTEFHAPGEAFSGAPLQPFHIGKGRVTRPDAPVQVLVPGHRLMNHPNRIQSSDWDGWDQERALYLPEQYAAGFTEILSIEDPGQPPARSALLHTDCGDGEYVYCSLALWRQLKKLHPGAVRLLANLLTPRQH